MSDVPSVWASLACTDPRVMIRFLVEAFGFTERVVYADGQTVHHAELTWTGPSGQAGGVMLGPAAECGEMPPPGSGAIHVVTDDPDGRFAAAVAAGATVVHEPTDVDYGSRICELRDPEGNLWSFGTWYE
ncbi:VOC family protein [Pseudonocardia endophytica]|uniref:Putative glyoxalase superfamily protein PhnB n=1 Tax=Pseudonocardia endophytica TaxID=401976 RepID=A0A4R1HV65_PSEEN|nr:VOC family protein [Pseudonocardia endophytica]TCK25311.1 putative glyoxalase superfamily protein PhnB [Pseudonocardia endophytica]